MNQSENIKIAIVGTGNVASHLVKAFLISDCKVKQILSRDIHKAGILVKNTDIQPIDNPNMLDKELDLVILAIQDDALNSDFLNSLPKNFFVAHTSGSVDISVLENFKSFGVFYPLQTFSKVREINYNSIPICIEANNIENENFLLQLASKISKDIRKIDSEQRKQIHLAAVFACNFTNYLFHISEQILKEKNLDFEILFPLLEETIQKVKHDSPRKMQTGPAVRNDRKIMQKHIEMLGNNPDYQMIYTLLSEKIQELK